MAITHNYVCAMGYLGADPEVRKLDRGEVISFSVAATERWGGSGRDAQEHTEWFRCQCFMENLIPVIEKYLRKGDPCMVEGKLRTRRWEDRDGVERFTTEVIVHRVQLLGGASDGADSRGGRDSRDARGGGGGRGDDRGRDRGGRDERGSARRDEPRGRDDDRRGGRDDRTAARGRDDDRGAARGGRDDDRRGARDDDRGRSTARTAQRDDDLDDEIPF